MTFSQYGVLAFDFAIKKWEVGNTNNLGAILGLISGGQGCQWGFLNLCSGEFMRCI